MIIEGMHYNENCECESCKTVSKKPKQIGSMTNKKILEEFDDKFEIPKSCPDFLKKHLSELLMHIRAFLSAKLDQARTEERERVRGMIEKLETDVYAEREYLCISKEEVMGILNKLTK